MEKRFELAINSWAKVHLRLLRGKKEKAPENQIRHKCHFSQPAVFLLFLFITSIILVSIRTALSENAKGTLTLMVYMCGSDLENYGGYASRDMTEINEACAGNKNVTVLIMAGGSRKWSNGQNASEITITEVGWRGSRTIKKLPSMNMGAPETLSVFLELGAELYPASNYALILWDHGGGPLGGVCFDDQNGRDSLTLKEISSAIQNSTFSKEKRLSWVGFDACLMATVETATYCSQFADYLVASEETEPTSGWNYCFLNEISENYDPVKVCSSIVNNYSLGKEKSELLTISLIDLSKIPQLNDTITKLFEKLRSNVSEQSFSRLSIARRKTKEYGRTMTGTDYDLVDLYNLSENFRFAAPGEAQALCNQLRETVIHREGNQRDSNGLSIYYPCKNRDMFIGTWQNTFRSLVIEPSYQKYIDEYAKLWMSDSFVDWTNLKGKSELQADSNIQRISINLSDEQLPHFAEAEVRVWMDYGSTSKYSLINEINSTELTGNTLTACYSNEALYVVSEDGKIISSPITFYKINGYYVIHANLGKETILSRKMGREDSFIIRILCQKDEESNELKILNISPYDSESTNLGRQSISIDSSEWPYILFLDNTLNITEDEGITIYESDGEDGTGNILYLDAYSPDGEFIQFGEDEWIEIKDSFTELGYHSPQEADNRKKWTLRFCPVNSSGRDLYAIYHITDTQGYSYYSELIPLVSPDVVSAAALKADRQNTEGITLIPQEARIVKNDNEKSIYIRMRTSNDGSRTESIRLWISDLIIDGLSCPSNIIYCSRSVGVESNALIDARIDCSWLYGTEDGYIHSISFNPILFLEDNENDSYIRMKRIQIDTLLDITPLILPDPPGDKPLGEKVFNGVRFRIISLKEMKGGIGGTVHITNEGGGEKRILFAGEDGKWCTLN